MIIEYSDKYKNQFCDLYINTWKEAPFFELFSKQECEVIINKLANKFIYLFIDDETNNLIGFIGGQALENCLFFKNEAEKPVDIKTAFYIAELAIDKSCRGKKIGTQLMDYLIDKAKKNGFNEFVLRTHQESKSVKFYNDYGYETRTMKDGSVHGSLVTQKRIGSQPEEDFRYYYYLVK